MKERRITVVYVVCSCVLAVRALWRNKKQKQQQVSVVLCEYKINIKTLLNSSANLHPNRNHSIKCDPDDYESKPDVLHLVLTHKTIDCNNRVSFFSPLFCVFLIS